MMNRSNQIQQAEDRNITRQAIIRSIFAFAILLIFLEGESNRNSSSKKKSSSSTVGLIDSSNTKTNIIKPSKPYPHVTNVSEILSLLHPNHEPIHNINSSGTFDGTLNRLIDGTRYFDSFDPSLTRFQLDINSREVFDSTPGFYYIYGSMKLLNSASMSYEFNSEVQHLVLQQQTVLPIQGM